MTNSSPATRNIPGRFLQKTCTVVVVFCALHLTVTMLYYFNTFEIIKNSVSAQNSQQKNINVSTVYPTTMSQIAPVTETAAIFKTEAEETKPKKLEQCPETSPLLGKDLLLNVMCVFGMFYVIAPRVCWLFFLHIFTG